MPSVAMKLGDKLGRYLVTPLLPGDYLQYFNPLWSTREVRGRVVSVRQLTEDSALLHIRPGRGFGFDFRPGQYLGIGVLVDGRWWWRSYSILPLSTDEGIRGGGRQIAIAVKAKRHGFLSEHLVSKTLPGSIVRLAPPAGDFFLPDPVPRRILFLSAGSGITPMIAMLRDLKARDTLTDIMHIHSIPSRNSMMFADELSTLSQDYPGYRLQVRVTEIEGRFDLDDLATVCPDWSERSSWACGPAGFVDAAEKHWRGRGIAALLNAERFDLRRAGAGSGGTVTFGRSGKSAVVDGASTFLEAAERAGVSLPHGCRMGVCRTCVQTLYKGRAVDIRTGLVHEEGARVQTCVCAPAGDCTIGQ